MKRTLAAFVVVTLCWLLLPPRFFGAERDLQTHPRASAKDTVRDLGLGIEVKPASKTIVITIANYSEEKRYLTVPPDLTFYRITLTDENGQLLELTKKGVEEFELGIGSVRVTELRKDAPWSCSVDLGTLFAFPERGTILCEVSRLVHFSGPQQKPSKSEWMKFPRVSIVIGDDTAPERVSPKHEGDAKPSR